MTIQELYEMPEHKTRITAILLNKSSRLKYRRQFIYEYLKEEGIKLYIPTCELKQLLYKVQGYKSDNKHERFFNY